jgi:hypothetical protein
MNLNNHEAIALEMAINRAIDSQLDAIVQTAVVLAAKLEGSGMRENQLRNVLDTALHTQSLEMVANFIRYQIGRGSDWQRNGFGEAVVATLEKDGVIHQTTARTIAQVRSFMTENSLPIPADAIDEAVIASIRMKLARRLLAEMNRAFLYADRAAGWSKLKPILAPVDLTAAAPVSERSGREG